MLIIILIKTTTNPTVFYMEILFGQKLPKTDTVISKRVSNIVGDCFKSVWPFQNVRTLIWTLILKIVSKGLNYYEFPNYVINFGSLCVIACLN